MTRIPWSVVAGALALVVGGPAGAAVQAGVSAAVRGDVDLLSIVENVKRPIASGEDVFLGDAISSYDASGMQLMLLDETVFTIGPNTDLTVDEFVYDPATGAGEVTASLAKGVFRFVTGKIAQGNPEDVTINLPVGTIGIRGTIGAARYDGERAFVVLLGPGRDNNADAREGRLAVTAAGETVELIRQRFGTIIEPGQPPSAPFEFSDAQLASIVGPLSPRPTTPEPADKPAGGAATDVADQDTAEAKVTAVAAQANDERSKEIDDTEDDSSTTDDDDKTRNFCASLPDCTLADATSDPNLADELPPTLPLIQQGITSVADLALISTGQFTYVGSGTAVGSQGEFDFGLDIDFGARTLGGGTNSFLEFDTFDPVTGNFLSAADFDLSTVSFDSGIGGQAVFNVPGTQVFGAGGCAATCTLNLNVSLVNTGTQLNGLANGADVDFSVVDSANLGVATGTGTARLLGIASLADLATIQTGQFHYAVTAQPCVLSSGGGTGFDFAVNIDFGARTIGGGESFLDLLVVDSQGIAQSAAEFGLSTVSFDSGIAGQAAFNVPGTQVFGSGACSGGCTLDLNVDLLNAGTQADIVAGEAAFDFLVQDSGGFFVASDDDIAPRFDGLIPPEVTGTIASFDELRSIQTGTFFYQTSGVFTQDVSLGNPVNIAGTFEAAFDIDFGARTIGGGGSFIFVDTSSSGGNIIDSTGINAISYANDVGLAQGVFDSTDLTNPNFVGTTGALINSNGIIANQAHIDVNYFDPSQRNAGFGSGDSQPRQPF